MSSKRTGRERWIVAWLFGFWPLAGLSSSAWAQNANDLYLDRPVGDCVADRFAPGYGYRIQQDYAHFYATLPGRRSPPPAPPQEDTEPYRFHCYHAGVDIHRDDYDAGDSDTTFDAPVFAAADGRVIAVLHWGGLDGEGYGVLVEHEGTSYYTQYAHLQLPVVQEGQPVRRGQFLGRLMNYPGGPDHVHFEVRPQLRVSYCARGSNCAQLPSSCRGNGYSLIATHAGPGDRLDVWGFVDPVDVYFASRPPFPPDRQRRRDDSNPRKARQQHRRHRGF